MQQRLRMATLNMESSSVGPRSPCRDRLSTWMYSGKEGWRVKAKNSTTISAERLRSGNIRDDTVRGTSRGESCASRGWIRQQFWVHPERSSLSAKLQ
ncbi:hypothetical protein MRX96_054338 [Rhipicephalus microplus]